MAVLKGNTYIDGDLIVDGNVTVGSLSAAGVNFTQIEGSPEDSYIALTTSNGNLAASSLKEVSDGTTTTYTLDGISKIDVNNRPLTITSSEVNIETPVNKVTAGSPGKAYWVYKDESSRVITDADDGWKEATLPHEYPVGVVFK